MIGLVGPEHVLMGTDYPFDMGELDPVGRINSVPGLLPEDRRKMLGLTAARLLGLPPPT